MSKFWFTLGLLALCCTLTLSFYSSSYRKCILPTNKNKVINNQGDMQIERVGIMRNYPQMEPIISHRLPLQYMDNTSLIYHQFLGAGASGQVYIIEHEFESPISPGRTIIEPKIAKRFFHEDIQNFEQENYIMKKLGYGVQWIREYGTQRMPAQEHQVLEGQKHNQFTTMALYPFKNSKQLYQVDPDYFNTPILMYKLSQKLQKAHSMGIIHDDIKLANILVTIDNPDMAKFFDVKLIDWNLASFYFPGFSTLNRKGTPCYFSPQQLFNTEYLTPATDVWTLGLTMYYFLAGSKPFKVKCSFRSDNNLQSIASLVGLDAIQKIIEKYRFPLGRGVTNNLQIMRKHPNNFTKTNLEQLIPKQHKERFTPELIDLLNGMLKPDLEQRLTMNQVINHPYFKNVRNLPPMYYARNKKQGMMTHEMLGDREDFNQYHQHTSFDPSIRNQNYKGDRITQQLQHRFDLDKYKIVNNVTKQSQKKVKIETNKKKLNQKKEVQHPIINLKKQIKMQKVMKAHEKQLIGKLNDLSKNQKKNNFYNFIKKNQQKLATKNLFGKQQKLDKHKNSVQIKQKEAAKVEQIVHTNEQKQNKGIENKQKLKSKRQVRMIDAAKRRKIKIPKHKKAFPKPDNKKRIPKLDNKMAKLF